MSIKNAASVRRILSVLSAISIVVAGVCLIAGCISIYDSGEFSREAVAAAFSEISIPVYICLALTVLGLAWDMVFTPEKVRQKPSVNDEMLLKSLSEKRDIDSLDEAKSNALKAERKKRKTNNLIQAAIYVISGVIFLIYALDTSNFGSDINASVIGAMRVLFPCVSAAFICSVAVLYLNKKSIAREIAILKESAKRENSENADTTSGLRNRTIILSARIIILVFAISILVYGFASGGTKDVLTKAVNICTECIGLG